MTFWLKSALIIIQRIINTLFSDILGAGVYAYLDDLLVSGKDVETHLANLKAVLLKLKDAGLKAKLAKCEFLKLKICFLGYKVDGDGISTMDDKIAATKHL